MFSKLFIDISTSIHDSYYSYQLYLLIWNIEHQIIVYWHHP